MERDVVINEGQKTSEIKKMPVGEKFCARGVVSRCALRKDKKGQAYREITLMDSDGTIDGRIWASVPWYADDSKKPIAAPFTDERTSKIEGKTLELHGFIEEYQGKPQCAITTVYYVNQEKYPPHTFVRRSPVPHEVLEKKFRELCEMCGEPTRSFLDFVFDKNGFWEKYKDWPAAVAHHHAYVGGLLEHSVAVTRAARTVAKIYISLGAKIDIDVVTAGALLHDLGKIEAYTLNPAPAASAMTTIIDHVVLGYASVKRLGEEFGLDEKYLLPLLHVLLSHHGTKEFGSPVLPATHEALIVAAADDLDFKLYCCGESVAAIEEGKDVSEFHHAMQRRFWKGTEG